MNDLKDRVTRFIADSGAKKTLFADKVGIGRTTLYKWLEGSITISANIENKIDRYLREFNY